jgi:hypothetical protein
LRVLPLQVGFDRAAVAGFKKGQNILGSIAATTVSRSNCGSKTKLASARK